MTILLLAIAVFLAQSGFYGYTAALPIALARGGVPDAAIGLVVGLSALVQIPAAVAGGRLLDRFGGDRVLIAGGLAYLAGSLLLALPQAEPASSLAPFLAARVCQGAGIAIVVPAALSLVPTILAASGQASGLSAIGAAGNLTVVVLPPLSLAILGAAGLHALAATVAGLVLAGLLAAGLARARLPSARASRAPSAAAAAGPIAAGAYGLVFRRAWAVPLAVAMLYMAHWGAVTAYLPVRAQSAGADVGMYFAAYGSAVFAMRMPTAWLASRWTSRALIAAGAGSTALAVGMLLMPLSTPWLVASGLLAGGASAAVLSPVLFELNCRSSSADRGSAFALYSGALAVAISLGSIGGAPLVAAAGLGAALWAGIALIAVALALALADPSLRAIGTRSAAGAAG